MNWEGFLMGVSDYGVERLKEERALKMQRELEALREKHAVAAELRQQSYKAKEVKQERESSTDPMVVESVNPFGEVISSRAKSASQLEAEEAARQKVALDNLNTQSQIDTRKEELAIRRESNAIDRERNNLSRAASAAATAAQTADAGPMQMLLDLGYKAPTAGNAVSSRNWARMVETARDTAQWGLANDAPKDMVEAKLLQSLLNKNLLEDPKFID